MSDTTPADLAQQAADKAQEAQQAADNGDYTQAGEALDQAQAKADEYDKATDNDELLKRIARLDAENRKLKDENGDRRVKAKEAKEEADARLKKVLQALGVEPSDDDPEEQIKQAKQAAAERERERDELQNQLNQLREGEQLRHLAKQAGADPDLLVPYLRGSGQLPAWGDDEWEGKATRIVTDTLNTFPQFKPGGTAPRTSGNTTGPTRNDDHLITADELKSMTAEEIYAANKAGKLKHLY